MNIPKSNMAVSVKQMQEVQAAADHSGVPLVVVTPPAVEGSFHGIAFVAKPTKKYKKHKVKDPSAPKRPMSAFMFFSNATRPVVRAEQPSTYGALPRRSAHGAWSWERAVYMLPSRTSDCYRRLAVFTHPFATLPFRPTYLSWCPNLRLARLQH